MGPHRLTDPNQTPNTGEYWMADTRRMLTLTDPNQTPNTGEYWMADRRWMLTSIVKRETTLTDS